MKRRQFGAMLATATFSLGSLSSVAARGSAQATTDPLEIEDVTVTAGGVTSSVGRARFSYEDDTMAFEVSDWTMEGETRTLSIDTASLAADGVSAETYATIRASMVDAVSGRTLSPLAVGLAEADVNPDAAVEASLGSVETNGQLVADEVTATGTVESVVPEGTSALLEDGVTTEELLELGSSEWSQVTVTRGDARLVASDVVMEREGASVLITSPSGDAIVSDRTFEYSEMAMTVSPPETIPQEHVAFASEVRQLASEGDLTFSALRSAASESGVTAANTMEAIENARFTLSFAEVTEGGEAVVADFETSGTLAELAQVVQTRV